MNSPASARMSDSEEPPRRRRWSPAAARHGAVRPGAGRRTVRVDATLAGLARRFLPSPAMARRAAMTYRERAAMLAAVVKVLQAATTTTPSPPLTAASVKNDSAGDIDGGIHTLLDLRCFRREPASAASPVRRRPRTAKEPLFQSRHVLGADARPGALPSSPSTSRPGSVEKAAPALLSGVPVVVSHRQPPG